ncbi:MAG: hypothetical protein SFW35_01225 [Chitinophagales bacterium]|nr:hypothetical protein [Chitinophagales bacterium]
MKQFIFVLLMVWMVLPIIAQNQKDTVFTTLDAPEQYQKKKRQYAIYSINKLKDGALLVRLKTREQAIKLYRQNGATDIADNIQADQEKENLRIVAAFREAYKFSPVYFFFSSATDSVKKGIRSGYFLNDSLKIDPKIVLKEDFFMIAEFGPLQAETYTFAQEGGTSNPDNTGSLERALLVRDSYFIQMRDPFPFYVSAMVEKPRMMAAHVKNLNDSFFRFYEKHQQEQPFYPFND